MVESVVEKRCHHGQLNPPCPLCAEETRVDRERIEQYDDGDDVECWQCGGEGYIANCWEEFACIDPEGGCDACLERCDIYEGKGGWHRGA